MRFLLGVLMLWGAVALMIFSEWLPWPKGLLCGGWLGCLILRRAKDDPSFQKWRNRLRRWWGRIKLEYKFGQQNNYTQRRCKEKYALVSECLTEEQIRAWISEEMQNEITQYGIAVDYRFLAEGGEIEERARKQAISFAKKARFFFFVKVAWMPDWFRKGYVKGATEGLVKHMSNWYGEVLAQEIAESAFGEPGDSCVFYPKVIKEKWMNIDFNRLSIRMCGEQPLRITYKH